MVCLSRLYHFPKAVFHNFTWSILEYFVSYVLQKMLKLSFILRTFVVTYRPIKLSFVSGRVTERHSISIAVLQAKFKWSFCWNLVSFKRTSSQVLFHLTTTCSFCYFVERLNFDIIFSTFLAWKVSVNLNVRVFIFCVFLVVLACGCHILNTYPHI